MGPRPRRYLLRDRDAIYGGDWADNGYGGSDDCAAIARAKSIRRASDRIRTARLFRTFIVWNERSLRRTLRSYFACCPRSRSHLALAKDAPESRVVEKPERGRIVVIPQVGGLTAASSIGPLRDCGPQRCSFLSSCKPKRYPRGPSPDFFISPAPSLSRIRTPFYCLVASN